MERKEKLIFKYFDTYCRGELIPNEGNEDWLQPSIDTNSLGYDVESKILYCNGAIEREIYNFFF